MIIARSRALPRLSTLASKPLRSHQTSASKLLKGIKLNSRLIIIINCHDIVDDSLIKVSIQRFGRSCPNSLTKSTFEVLFWEQILGMQMLYLQPSLILGFDSLPYNQSVF
ncbi:hypothetical protein NC652_012946 [Populus alba x Populus x berolinensis]|nr:hypothetical protein NC652_012946 [Populus alba x Populus x berolinensis]